MWNIKKYLPIRIHHIIYGYGYWFGARFYFWHKGPIIVPMWNEHNNAVYSYSLERIERGCVDSWGDERSRERKKNMIKKRIRMRYYEYGYMSEYKYIIEQRGCFGKWKALDIKKTYDDAKAKVDEYVNENMKYV